MRLWVRLLCFVDPWYHIDYLNEETGTYERDFHQHVDYKGLPQGYGYFLGVGTHRGNDAKRHLGLREEHMGYHQLAFFFPGDGHLKGFKGFHDPNLDAFPMIRQKTFQYIGNQSDLRASSYKAIS